MTDDPRRQFIKPLDDAIAEMTHIRVENLQGRPVPLTTLHDKDGWHMWIPMEDGQIMHIRPVDAAEAMYIAAAPAREHDLWFPFLDFLVQRFDTRSLHHWMDAIVDDIWSLCASMAKLEVLHRTSRTEENFGYAWMVATEIEYVVSVCRNMFDLLQEVINAVWKSIRLHGSERPNRELRQSYADMVMRNDQPMSAAEIAAVRKVPGFLADYYGTFAPFFAELRKYRNRLVHGGASVEFVFVAERGFAIGKNVEPFASWNVWDDGCIAGNLASLRPVLAHMINNTLYAFTGFTSLMAQTIEFKPPFAPGHQVYLRGHLNGALVRTLSGARWWDTHER